MEVTGLPGVAWKVGGVRRKRRRIRRRRKFPSEEPCSAGRCG